MLIEGLYTISSFQNTENTLDATVILDQSHEVFKGHFPNNPVLPGVCMMQMIKELLAEAVQHPLQLTSCSNIKFMAIINPENNPELQIRLQWTKEEANLKTKCSIAFEDTVALKMSAIYIPKTT